MRLVIVADGASPGDGESSRDPAVLGNSLRSLGHEVTELRVVETASSLAPSLQTHPDVVLGLGAGSPVTAAVVADSLGVPLALCLPPELFYPFRPSRGYGRLVCRHLPHACLIAESYRHLAAAVKFGADPHKSFVIEPGITLDSYVFRPPPTADGISIIFDASRTPSHEQAFLQSVLNRLVTERHRSVYTAVLTTPENDEVRQADIETIWGNNPNTSVHHVSSHKDVPCLYTASHIVVVPSLATDGTISAMRAMAAGRPLVVADCPQMRDMVGTIRDGVLAMPMQENEWLDKLDYLLEEKSLRRYLGKNGRARAEMNFSLTRTARNMEDRLLKVTASWRHVQDTQWRTRESDDAY